MGHPPWSGGHHSEGSLKVRSARFQSKCNKSCRDLIVHRKLNSTTFGATKSVLVSHVTGYRLASIKWDRVSVLTRDYMLYIVVLPDHYQISHTTLLTVAVAMNSHLLSILIRSNIWCYVIASSESRDQLLTITASEYERARQPCFDPTKAKLSSLPGQGLRVLSTKGLRHSNQNHPNKLELSTVIP
ncbi:hypothetical protein J6590_013940 [Homalodisca vitripennis]|nr:hypothetical protein J6590_013940 [Homalodisca vitripennis]